MTEHVDALQALLDGESAIVVECPAPPPVRSLLGMTDVIFAAEDGTAIAQGVELAPGEYEVHARNPIADGRVLRLADVATVRWESDDFLTGSDY